MTTMTNTTSATRRATLTRWAASVGATLATAALTVGGSDVVASTLGHWWN